MASCPTKDSANEVRLAGMNADARRLWVWSSARQITTLAAVTLLIAGLIGFLVFVLFEVSLLAVVKLTRLVILAFAHTLLVCFVFRIILVLKWSRHGLNRGSADTNTHRYRQNADVTFQIHFHSKVIPSSF